MDNTPLPEGDRRMKVYTRPRLIPAWLVRPGDLAANDEFGLMLRDPEMIDVSTLQAWAHCDRCGATYPEPHRAEAHESPAPPGGGSFTVHLRFPVEVVPSAWVEIREVRPEPAGRGVPLSRSRHTSIALGPAGGPEDRWVRIRSDQLVVIREIIEVDPWDVDRAQSGDLHLLTQPPPASQADCEDPWHYQPSNDPPAGPCPGCSEPPPAPVSVLDLIRGRGTAPEVTR